MEVAREQGVVLREAGAAAERVLPDGAVEPLGERHRGGPALLAVEPSAHHERGRPRLVDQLGQLVRVAGVDRGRLNSRAGAATATSSSAGSCQSPIGTTTSAGPRRVRASCQARAIAPGTSCGRTGWFDQTGYSPAIALERRAR